MSRADSQTLDAYYVNTSTSTRASCCPISNRYSILRLIDPPTLALSNQSSSRYMQGSSRVSFGNKVGVLDSPKVPSPALPIPLVLMTSPPLARFLPNSVCSIDIINGNEPTKRTIWSCARAERPDLLRPCSCTKRCKPAIASMGSRVKKKDSSHTLGSPPLLFLSAHDPTDHIQPTAAIQRRATTRSYMHDRIHASIKG